MKTLIGILGIGIATVIAGGGMVLNDKTVRQSGRVTASSAEITPATVMQFDCAEPGDGGANVLCWQQDETEVCVEPVDGLWTITDQYALASRPVACWGDEDTSLLLTFTPPVLSTLTLTLAGDMVCWGNPDDIGDDSLGVYVTGPYAGVHIMGTGVVACDVRGAIVELRIEG